jgi:DNA repair exonuclease SbcCD nuclease subunit
VPERDKKVVLAFSADWHLSDKPPLVRSSEKSWWDVQSRYFDQIRRLTKNIPLVVAGDIFDKPNPSVGFINFCIDEIPEMYAIPGNHEMPYHSYDYLESSAFIILQKCKKIRMFEHLDLGNGVILHGFPFGSPLEPCKEPSSFHIDVAVTHEFVWTDKTGYPGAKPKAHLDSFRERATGYDLVICGDNHKPFKVTKQTPMIVNCGSLMRLTIDQLDYRPRIWYLYSDNTVEPVYLDTTEDVFLTPERILECVNSEKIESLIDLLQECREEFASFPDVVLRVLDENNVDAEVRQVVLSAMQRSS